MRALRERGRRRRARRTGGRMRVGSRLEIRNDFSLRVNGLFYFGGGGVLGGVMGVR